MSKLITCGYCGTDTDVNESEVCVNCGAELEKVTVSPGQEKLVSPVWGELSITIKDSEYFERASIFKSVSDIWDEVQEQQLTTILPHQVAANSICNGVIKLLCHSGIASKVKYELEQSSFKDVVETNFIEISDREFEDKVKVLQLPSA